MKLNTAILSLIATTLLCGCGASRQAATLEETLADALVDSKENPIEASNLLDTDYILLYFSAHWCPPCQAFTPKLVKFHKTNVGDHLFQTILISSDHSEKAMFAYMSETDMPWPAVRFRSPSAKTLDSIYSGDGIPRLVLTTPSGTIIADSFKGREYLGPQHVLDKLEELLTKRKPTPANRTTSVTNEPLPTPEQLIQKYKINGFGQGSEQDIAIINGQLTTKGSELEKGMVVENITSTYVEISHEGNRYRLYP